VLVLAGYLVRSRIDVTAVRTQPVYANGGAHDVPLPTPVAPAPPFEATTHAGSAAEERPIGGTTAHRPA
jgi:hypothetical protein